MSIISSLLYQTSGTYRLRTLNKFCVVGADDGGADASDKVERLAELHAKYLGRMVRLGRRRDVFGWLDAQGRGRRLRMCVGLDCFVFSGLL